MRALQAIGLALRGNALENPANALTGERLLSQVQDASELWGPGVGGASNPMKIGTAYRCVQIIAAAFAGCPIHVTEPATKKRVRIPVLEAEDAGPAPFATWETAGAHQALRGDTFVRKIRARTKEIVGLVPIDPGRVTVSIVDVQRAGIGVPYAKRFVIDGNEGDPLTENEIMHVPGLSLNGITGLSPVALMRRTFGLATAAEQLADKLFTDGMHLQGFLTTDLDINQEKALILQDRWRAKHAGVRNAWDVAVMDKGLKFQPMSMSPADAQFLETRKFSTTEIARLWGIPGWMVNDQEKSTSWGSGMETMFKSFVTLTLKPYHQRFEQRITREICDPRVEQASFSVEGLLRGDSTARSAFYASGIQNGWLTPNDVRELEDKPPVPWGNEPYLPNHTAAGDKPGATSTPSKGEDDDDDEQ